MTGVRDSSVQKAAFDRVKAARNREPSEKERATDGASSTLALWIALYLIQAAVAVLCMMLVLTADGFII